MDTVDRISLDTEAVAGNAGDVFWIMVAKIPDFLDISAIFNFCPEAPLRVIVRIRAVSSGDDVIAPMILPVDTGKMRVDKRGMGQSHFFVLTL